jgi:CBS domain-containing protein
MRRVSSIEARMRELEDEIRRHDYLYYVLDRPEMSDDAYDRLYTELRSLEEAHPDLVGPDSPTQRVAGAPLPSLPTARRVAPMLSLDSVARAADVRAFLARVGGALGRAPGKLVAAALMLPTDIDPTSPWETLARLGPIATLLFWLGPINLMVGAFNLIPGFPLDGGRVLRAILWRVTGDLRKATLTSSRVGRGIGFTFITMGIAMVFGARIPFFGQGPVSGIWLAFIGWFLSTAAERSYGALLVQDVLEGVRVAMLMRETGLAVPTDTTVSSLVNDWFMRSSERCFPVVEDGRLAGLVCMGDVRKLPQDSWSRAPVTAIMTPRDRLLVASPDEDASSALRKLGERDVDQLPVLEGELLVGMLTRAEVARWLELHLNQPRFGAPRPA